MRGPVKVRQRRQRDNAAGRDVVRRDVAGHQVRRGHVTREAVGAQLGQLVAGLE
jgi:hypothetical protein